MSKKPLPVQAVVTFQSRAFAHGISVASIMERAGISGSTWTAWRRGGVPRIDTMEKAMSALDALIAEQGGARD